MTPDLALQAAMNAISDNIAAENPGLIASQAVAFVEGDWVSVTFNRGEATASPKVSRTFMADGDAEKWVRGRLAVRGMIAESAS